MRVTEYLDLEDHAGVVARARGSWPEWADLEPRLRVTHADDVFRWVRSTAPPEKDDVLHAMATLAARDGGDDVVAATTLAWLLSPGACRLARELKGLPVDSHALVAVHFWIQVRTFDWRRLRRVAANIVMQTRAACLSEAGTKQEVTYGDRAWRMATLVAPDSRLWDRLAAGGAGHMDVLEQSEEDADDEAQARCAVVEASGASAEELADVLSWACETSVISADDAELLRRVVDEARHVVPFRVSGRYCGLTSPEIAGAVAKSFGLSHATVRRRTARALRALAAVAHRYAA